MTGCTISETKKDQILSGHQGKALNNAVEIHWKEEQKRRWLLENNWRVKSGISHGTNEQKKWGHGKRQKQLARAFKDNLKLEACDLEKAEKCQTRWNQPKLGKSEPPFPKPVFETVEVDGKNSDHNARILIL
ncbi:hypothetical protein BU15DRAFT_62668 [Melanogaster broomeanus]|nr:hypothetical protein BU15DRAFT_62668 [Melanogaster broomeanus]